MIRKGSIVRRKADDYCCVSLGIRYNALMEHYPPEGDVCIVTSKPREVDLCAHDRNFNPKRGVIVLKRGVEVIHHGKWYGPCDIQAFEEVKDG